jgi:hypothetical protein
MRIEGSDDERAVCFAHVVGICKLDLIHNHLCTRNQVVLYPDNAPVSCPAKFMSDPSLRLTQLALAMLKVCHSTVKLVRR